MDADSFGKTGVASVIPCEAARLCSTLKHDWLEHQVIRPMRAERARCVNEKCDVPLPPMFDGFSEWLSESRKLALTAGDGFSPRQLVDQSPLSQLSDEFRAVIKVTVHQAYLDQWIVQPVVADLLTTICSFEAASEELRQTWSSSEQDRRARAIDNFESAAIRLLDTLDRFPRGVVLS